MFADVDVDVEVEVFVAAFVVVVAVNAVVVGTVSASVSVSICVHLFLFHFYGQQLQSSCHAVSRCLSVCLLGGGSVNIIARTEISCSVQLRQLKHFLCYFMVYLPNRNIPGAGSQHLSENKQSKCRAEARGAGRGSTRGQDGDSVRWSLPVVRLISIAN